MNIFNAFIAAVLIVSFSGCATILKPKTTSFEVKSEPSDASVYLDGVRVGKTPLTTSVSNKKALSVVVKKDGYEEIGKNIPTHTAWGYFILDILFWPGLIIDVICNDNAHTLNETKVAFNLEPKAEAAVYVEPMAVERKTESVVITPQSNPATPVKESDPASKCEGVEVGPKWTECMGLK